MATIDKNFRIKNGLVVEGSTATVGGNNVLVENASDQYILNLIGGETLVKSVDINTFTVDGSGNLTINANTFDSYGSAAAAQSAAETYADNAATSAENAAKAYADGLAPNYDPAGSASAAQTAAQNYADGLAINYDAAGAANTAQTNAQNYTDTALNSYTPTSSLDATVSGYGYLKSADLNGYATETYVDQAETDANTYTDNAISNLGGSGTASVAGHIDVLTGTGIDVNPGNNSIEIARQTVDTWYDAAGSAATAEQNANIYTDNAVSALVDSAPAMLDTLNELAAAIADNPNYATDVTNLVATKADTTYVDNQISSLDTTAQGYATTAENNAKSYADGLAGNYEALGNVQSAVDNLVNGITQFTEVSVGWMSREVASYAYESATNQVTAYAWDKWKGSSAKFLVRVRNGVHSQVSEILLTKDDSDNIAITEYAIVTTNGILADITASYDSVSSQIQLKATPAHTGGTEIIVSGTLMSYGD